MSNEPSSSRERGEAILKQLFGRVPQRTGMLHSFNELTVENLFGDVWSRPGLELTERSLATVAVLAALGREQQLRSHLTGALNLGVEPKKLQELMIHVAHYAGWPTGMIGLQALEEVMKAREAGG